jgi:hypothetical protein
MSKRTKAKPNSGPAAAPAGKKFPVGVVSLFALAAVVVLSLWLNRSQLAPTLKDTRPAETNVLNAPAAPVTPKTEPGFQKLVGRWLRPDGGYVIEVKSVNDSGKMEAAYFNPNPIHVAKAEASQDSSATKVFLELRDVNYPGSTYTLTYNPASDQLQGIYYQAAIRERFQVFFERLK